MTTPTTSPLSLRHEWRCIDPASIYLGRTLIAQACDQWDLQDLWDDACLMTQELVCNAANAAPRSRVLLIVERRPAHLVVRVWDSAPGLPVPTQAAETDETGRGLFIVAALCGENNTGIQHTKPTGKWVWAQLPTESDG